MKRSWWVLPVCLAAVLPSAGCSTDLGACDPDAARELVYSQSGQVATKGQALAHDSCGSAAFCHSREAHGEDRFGAPGRMNFDMLPAAEGREQMRRWARESWAQVRDGHMPPGGEAKKRTQSDSGWRFSTDPESRRLDGIDSKGGKAAFRNWLSCGAPVVDDTALPEWAMPGFEADAGETPDFRVVYEQVLQPSCTSGCHSDAARIGDLSLEGLCDAFEALADTGSCGEVRANAGDPDSLLLDLVDEIPRDCAGPMPPGNPLPESRRALVRAWVLGGMPSIDCD